VSDALNNYSQLDILLPSQHLATSRRGTPEQRLMIAVLHDALDCIMKYELTTEGGGQRIFQEAKSWLLASEKHWPYSFDCICEVLDLDSEAILKQVRLKKTDRGDDRRSIGKRGSAERFRQSSSIDRS